VGPLLYAEHPREESQKHASTGVQHLPTSLGQFDQGVIGGASSSYWVLT